MGKIKVADFYVKYKGVHSLEWVYKIAREWLLEHEYTDPFGKDEYMEKLYLEKASPGGSELWIWWENEKIPQGKSNYYKQVIQVRYHVLGLTKAEAMYKGKKVKMHKGEPEIQIRSWIETDYKKMFANNPILKHLNKFFQERVLKKRLEFIERDLYRDTYKLQGTLKKFLHMKRWDQAADYFHPSMKGYP